MSSHNCTIIAWQKPCAICKKATISDSWLNCNRRIFYNCRRKKCHPKKAGNHFLLSLVLHEFRSTLNRVVYFKVLGRAECVCQEGYFCYFGDSELNTILRSSEHFRWNWTEIVQSANECTAASDIHHEFEKEMNSQTKLISMNCPLQLAHYTQCIHSQQSDYSKWKTMAMTLCDANRDSIFPSFSLLNHLT